MAFTAVSSMSRSSFQSWFVDVAVPSPSLSPPPTLARIPPSISLSAFLPQCSLRDRAWHRVARASLILPDSGASSTEKDQYQMPQGKKNLKIARSRRRNWTDSAVRSTTTRRKPTRCRRRGRQNTEEEARRLPKNVKDAQELTVDLVMHARNCMSNAKVLGQEDIALSEVIQKQPMRALNVITEIAMLRVHGVCVAGLHAETGCEGSEGSRGGGEGRGRGEVVCLSSGSVEKIQEPREWEERREWDANIFKCC